MEFIRHLYYIAVYIDRIYVLQAYSIKVTIIANAHIWYIGYFSIKTKPERTYGCDFIIGVCLRLRMLDPLRDEDDTIIYLN